MKKIALLFIIMLGISSFAQDYKPLLNNFNEWHFTTCYFGCLTDVYYTNGDTLVDGVPHKVLDGFHYISRTFLLRENITDRQVFLTKVNTEGNSEYLLYDFTLEEGDVFSMVNPISPFPLEAGDFVVDSIRMRTLEDGNDYRHYYFSPDINNTISDNNCVWIEGVGSLSLINAPSGDPNINEVGQLSCFFKNGNLFYSDLDSISGCEPLLSVNDIVKPMNQLVLVNTPEVNRFELRYAKEVTDIEVFDLSGKKLRSIQNPSQTIVSMDFKEFSSGLYLVVAKNEMGRVKTLKFKVE